ncbi:transposase [Nocardia abscessus]|nr:Tn3 family transposase [Nocardia abscessus]MCC3331573.1 transposase [Nocardia abscessus]
MRVSLRYRGQYWLAQKYPVPVARHSGNRLNQDQTPDTAWTTTKYYWLAVDQLRQGGRRIDDEVLAHISPAHSENINFFGAIEVDIDSELAQLGPTGYRPLRVRDTLF